MERPHSGHFSGSSEESVKTAKKENQKYVDSGEVILTLDDVAELQYEEGFFELILSSTLIIVRMNVEDNRIIFVKELKVYHRIYLQ